MRYKYLDPAGWAARGAWVYDRLRPVSWVTVACQSFDSGLLSDRPSRLGPQACISEAGWSPLCQSARSARAGPGFVSGRLSQPGTHSARWRAFTPESPSVVRALSSKRIAYARVNHHGIDDGLVRVSCRPSQSEPGLVLGNRDGPSPESNRPSPESSRLESSRPCLGPCLGSVA